MVERRSGFHLLRHALRIVAVMEVTARPTAPSHIPRRRPTPLQPRSRSPVAASAIPSPDGAGTVTGSSGDSSALRRLPCWRGGKRLASCPSLAARKPRQAGCAPDASYGVCPSLLMIPAWRAIQQPAAAHPAQTNPSLSPTGMPELGSDTAWHRFSRAACRSGQRNCCSATDANRVSGTS